MAHARSAGFETPASSITDLVPVTASGNVVAGLGWDAEARATALARAHALARRDPDAAAELLAHLEQEDAAATRAAAQAIAQAVYPQHAGPLQLADYTGGVRAVLDNPNSYDPMLLYAAMGTRYAWMSKQVIDHMWFVTFFGYVREAAIAVRREQAQTDAILGQYGLPGAGTDQTTVADPDAAAIALQGQGIHVRRWDRASDAPPDVLPPGW